MLFGSHDKEWTRRVINRPGPIYRVIEENGGARVARVSGEAQDATAITKCQQVLVISKLEINCVD